MVVQPMDAVTSFAYLTENIPTWISQLDALVLHAAQKNAEFVAEYSRLVNQIKPRAKRVKSPSLHSLRSNTKDSIEAPLADRTPTPPLPDRVEIDPLVAGNRYLYAQAQRKRKPCSSVRSGASGPQKFRSKHQVVIVYDAHLQAQLDSMVKSIGLARNNLRKGKNALISSKGFQLPSLGRRFDASGLPSLEHFRSSTVSRSNPVLVSSSKYGLSSPRRQSDNEDEEAFMRTDKSLECVQTLCETAAHQFLRDGDCKSELDSGVTQLKSVLEEAKTVLGVLKDKARQEADVLEAEDSNGITQDDQTLQVDSESKRSSNPPVVSLATVDHKLGPTTKSPPLDSIAAFSAPTVPVLATLSTLPTAGVEIEVDDDSDQSSIEIDLSKYRARTVARLMAQA